MTDPKRLLERAAGECDAFEAELLRAGRGDAMCASSKRALVAAALGGSLAATAAAQLTGAGASAGAGAAAKMATGVLAKWTLLGVFGSALVISVGVLLTRAPASTATATATAAATTASIAAPSSPIPHVTTATAVTASASAAPTEPRPEATVAASPRAATAGSERPAATTGVVASASAHAPAGDTLAAEAAMLDDARDAVARRDGAAALAVLAEHQRVFPRPALADEAFVLRVEALAWQGDSEGVRALATPWLAIHPASPYAPRARRALAQSAGRDAVAPGDAPR